MSEHVLNELQLVQAMYDPADIHFHDPEVQHLVENCIPISDSVSLSIRLNDSVELDIRLPSGYPEAERLSAYCRLSKKGSTTLVPDRSAVQQWESRFNNELCQKYLSTQREINGGGDGPSILGVIQWCNDQFEVLPAPLDRGNCSASAEKESAGSIPGSKKTVSSHDSETLCRIWIFSHHIYNKNKRKFLVNTAEELELSGFSLPGKPGFICVEGDPKNCDDYWSRVRQLSWQKISLIERQLFPSSQTIFDNNPFKELHCDKSEFIKFLDDKNSSSVIKDYLGI